MTDREYIKTLEERDKAMPMGKFYFTSGRFKDDPPVDTCGICEHVVQAEWSFCPWCGQRIDQDNYKL